MRTIILVKIIRIKVLRGNKMGIKDLFEYPQTTG